MSSRTRSRDRRGSCPAFRASGSYRKQGGYIDSIGTAGSRVDRNINDLKNYGGRASLLWKPDSRLSVRLSALLQNLNVDGAPSFVEADPATLKPLYGGLTMSEYVPSFSNVNTTSRPPDLPGMLTWKTSCSGSPGTSPLTRTTVAWHDLS